MLATEVKRQSKPGRWVLKTLLRVLLGWLTIFQYAYANGYHSTTDSYPTFTPLPTLPSNDAFQLSLASDPYPQELSSHVDGFESGVSNAFSWYPDVRDPNTLNAMTSSNYPNELVAAGINERWEGGSGKYGYPSDDIQGTADFQILDPSTHVVQRESHPLEAASVHDTAAVDEPQQELQFILWQPEVQGMADVRILDSNTHAFQSESRPLEAVAAHGTATVVQQQELQFILWQLENANTPSEDVPELKDRGFQFEHHHTNEDALQALLDERAMNAQTNNNTTELARLLEINGDSEAIVARPRGLTTRDGSTTYLEVKPKSHPLLHALLPAASVGAPNKYVRVTYPNGFKRVVRKPQDRPTGRRGRPPVGEPRKRKEEGKTVNRCPCGKLWSSVRGIDKHCVENQVKCPVFLEQVQQLICIYCAMPTGATQVFDSEADCEANPVEAKRVMRDIMIHYSHCAYVCELWELIHPSHLDDSGIQLREMDPFPFPGRALVHQ